MPIPGENTGVIERLPSFTDYKAGEQITEVVRNPSGDWRKNEPPGEDQKLYGVTAPQNGFNTGGVDFLDCVSFSANDAIEILTDQQLSSWPAENVQWLRDNGYFNADGTLNLSDRFLAKVSGTTKDGNSLQTVAQAIRDYGIVPESMWPMPVSQIKADPNHYWEIYYAVIPQNVLDKGIESKKYFEVQYEFVFYPGSSASLSTVENSLKIAPLQIATAVCNGWNDANPIQGCGAGSQHATCMTYADANGYHILDHYAPYDKTLGSNYDITYGMRFIITPIPQDNPVVVANLKQQISLYQKVLALLQKLVSLRK